MYMVGYDAHVTDFALNLFLTTKTALYVCACSMSMFNNCSSFSNTYLI